MASLTAPRRTHRLLAQVLAVPVVAVVIVLGVWVAGGVVTDDFRGSAALTTVWFAVAAGLCLLVAVRRPALRVPVIGTYLVTAGAVGVFLASTTLRDRVVSERVVTGAAPVAAGSTPSVGASGAPAPRPKNVRVARGRFTSGEHATRGTAAIVRLADGRRFLTLTSFSTSPGPDLRVRLASSRTLDGGGPGAVDLGALKGNRGSQQYRIPASVGFRGRAVVIWCRAFSARFGSAVLGR
jgi:electron transfer DM13